MENRKWIGMLILCLVVVFSISGCGSTPDAVNDPLSDFDVDATIPFATRAVTATATPAPTVKPAASPTPTPTPAWQTEPNAGMTTYKPTAKPTQTPKPTPTPGPREEVLSKGSKGNNVLLLQKRLIELEYLSAGGADGSYGSKTESAVKLFQKMMGLDDTGIADLLTLKYVYANVKTYSQMLREDEPVYSETPVPSTQQGYSLLQKGSSGADVIKLQTRLAKLGYLDADIDGDYGTITENAVKLFQRALGWEETGVATASLQSYLYSSSAPYYSGSTPAGGTVTKAPSTSNYTQLSYGDKGTAVQNLQKRLKQLGYFEGSTAGNYYEKTENAVKLFQKAIGWKQTGVATAALQEYLYSTSAPYYTEQTATPAPAQTPKPSSGTTTLQYGSTGDTVIKLQKRLIELGYMNGEATGNFYGQTEAAVLLVQEQAGLMKTGIVDAALYKYIVSDNIEPYVTVIGTTGDDSTTDGIDPDEVILSVGSEGNKVVKVQNALANLGYYNGSADGKYEDMTIKSIKMLQKQLGYDTTGKATYALLERLLNDGAPTYEECKDYGCLYPGDTGDAVYRIQKRLVELGLFADYTSSDKSKFTLSTLDAVEKAQIKRGLTCIDSFASAEFQAYLFSDAAYFDNN